MNQDQLKSRLSQIRRSDKDFSLVLSGKSSKKVDGLYKPEGCEIILHNRNFRTDQELLYAAIHEYAHHIQFTDSPVPPTSRVHNSAFWSLFHSLLFEAENKGLYSSPFDSIEAFRSLTGQIRDEFISQNGSLMKRLGELLLEARRLCEQHHASFEDYVDRVLRLPRRSADTIMKAHLYDLNPAVGFENMRVLTRIKEADRREGAQESLLKGESPDMMHSELKPAAPTDPLVVLHSEKDRLEQFIDRLNRRLVEVNHRIQAYERKGPA